MRLNIIGMDVVSGNLKESFKHPTVGWKTESKLPQCNITIHESKKDLIEISCNEPKLELLVVRQLRELGVVSVILTRVDSLSDKDIEVSYPQTMTEEGHEILAKAIFRALQLYVSGKQSLWKRIWQLA